MIRLKKIKKIDFYIINPSNINNFFVVKPDKSLWKNYPQYIKKNKLTVPNRDLYLSNNELLTPKSLIIRNIFSKKSAFNYGVYIMFFHDFKKFYVGIAARYSYEKNGLLKKIKNPEGFFVRLKKHRAKCTGTFLNINHTDSKNNGWRTFAKKRYSYYLSQKKIDILSDCYLSFVIFRDHENFQDNDKGILEKLENYINTMEITHLFGPKFLGYTPFANTHENEINFNPKFQYINFDFVKNKYKD